MKFGLDDLIDSRLRGLVSESRAFYARRAVGRGPGSRGELEAVRATAAAPPPSDPPAAVEVACAGGRSVPVRLHTPVNRAAAGVHLQMPTVGAST